MNDQENTVERENTEIESVESFSPDFKYCSFTIGEKGFSIPIRYIKEILEPLDISPVPLSPSYLKGLIFLRGDVVPALDLSIIYDTPCSDDLIKNMIICDSERGSLCFLCDGMPDLNTQLKGTIIDMERIFDQYCIKHDGER